MFFLSVLLISAIFYLCLKTRHQSKHLLPPVFPGSLPVIGHAHKMMGNKNIRLMNFIQNFSSFSIKNGGVICVNIGLSPYYVITDPEDAVTAANACLQKHFLYDKMKAWLGDGLISRPSDTWKAHRKLINPAFSLPVINNFLPLFNSKSKELVEIIKPHDGKEPFDMMAVLRGVLMETSCLSTYGKALERGTALKNFMEIFSEMLVVFQSKFQKIWLHSDFIYQLLGYKKIEDYLIQYANGITTEVIRKTKEDRINSNNPESSNNFRSFIEVFLDSPSISNISDKEFMNEVDTMLAASFDTNWSSLTIALIMIGSYPEVQEQIYQEIIKVVGKDKEIEKEDLPKLAYTDAVIKECLRLMPAVPVVLRQVDKDVKLKNYTLPAGSSLVLSIYGINRHGWDDAELFKPERWINPPTRRNILASFSIGKRNCIGRTYAMYSLQVTIAHLIRAYKLTADVTKLVNKMEITAKPISGHEISITSRN